MPKNARVPLLSAALLFALIGVPAAAQVSGMPADIEAKVAALGAVINPPETAKLYAPLQEKEPYTEQAHHIVRHDPAGVGGSRCRRAASGRAQRRAGHGRKHRRATGERPTHCAHLVHGLG